MLHLADEIGRDDHRIGGLVGKDGDFGGAGEDVDADLAEQRALGLGDELVARPDDDVGGLAGEQTEGHRGDRLDAAERHDDVGAGDLHRVEHMRMDALAAERRRAGDHGLDACRLGGGDGHVGRGDMGIAAGRHIAAGGVAPARASGRATGRAAVRQEKSGTDCICAFGKLADVVGGKGDVVLDALRDVGGAPGDLVFGDHDVAAPLVELQRVVAHGLLAVTLDRCQHFVDDLARGAGFGFRRLRRFLQVGHGHRSALRIWR